jgi:phosphate transporter
LFNARADWLDSYVDYEALKKAIPEPAPAAQRTVRPATSSYTDLEAAPLLNAAEAEVSTGGEIAKGHQPFFKLLDKELRKIANFYEDKERELLRAGEELDRDLREEEERDLERVKEESWDPADSGLEPVGDADENEGESQLGSLGGFASTQRKSRSRSRNRISSASRSLRSLAEAVAMLRIADRHACCRQTFSKMATRRTCRSRTATRPTSLKPSSRTTRPGSATPTRTGPARPTAVASGTTTTRRQRTRPVTARLS